MPDYAGWPWLPHSFLALTPEQSRLTSARAVMVPVPYDSTTSFRTGARYGPQAIIEASGALEDYDWELDLDVSAVGIHTTPALEPHMGSPELMAQRVTQSVRPYFQQGKLVGVLGGEHSLTAGAVRACLESHPDLSVLYLDAHADLREEYMGARWGHASGARRILDLGAPLPGPYHRLVLAGVRSLSLDERECIERNAVPVFPWPPSRNVDEYIGQVVELLGPAVYVSIDLDVLDPSLMSAVGTPEPGGMGWYDTLGLLRRVAQMRRIVGFDVSELAPGEGPAACAYTAAKLVYKMVAYATRPSSCN